MRSEVISPELTSNTVPVPFVPGRTPKLPADNATSDSGPKAEQDLPHLLWIDDELNGSDAIVRLLELQGFRIRCAHTGAEGLALARVVDYRAILLDLRLPDLPGLSVLANLRADRTETPVVMITGFPDTESALVAGRLGAGAYHWKLDSVEELGATIQRLIRGPESATPGSPGPSGDLGPNLQTASLKALAALLEALERLTQPSVEAKADSENRATIRQALTKALLRALLEPSLPAALFLACAGAVKIVAEAVPAESAFFLADTARNRILETLGRSKPKHAEVVAALAMLESAAGNHKRLQGKQIAKFEGVSRGHLSGRVHDETGFYLTEWRSAYLLRPALPRLADTHEHVKQIACRLLGFAHESQFNHEFKGLFGLSPTEFRERSQRTLG